MADPAEQRKREVSLARDLVQSPVWEWLKENLEGQQKKLISLAGDPRLNSESRALLCGQLTVISTILTKPESILRVADRAEKTLAPSGEGKRRPAPKVTPD